MQLEELQEQWQRLERKLDQTLALETELVRRVIMRPARRRVNRLAIWPAIDVALCVVGLLLSMAFLRNDDHWSDWRLAIPAGTIILGFLGLLIDSIRQLDRISQLNWSGPVAVIQSSLERLRVAQIRQFKWIMLLSPLLGFCILIVGVQWLFEWLTDDRLKMIDKFDARWIAGNYAFGVVFTLIGYSIASVLARKYHGSRWWNLVLDGLSGTSLKAAIQDVERWASLRREEKSDFDDWSS